jgi:hypothetical protein
VAENNSGIAAEVRWTGVPGLLSPSAKDVSFDPVLPRLANGYGATSRQGRKRNFPFFVRNALKLAFRPNKNLRLHISSFAISSAISKPLEQED